MTWRRSLGNRTPPRRPRPRRPRRTSWTCARAGARLRRRRRCRISRRPSVLLEAGPRAASCRARRTPPGSRRRCGETRSISSRSRRETRLPELGPIRYGRMLVSPFTFFRGGAYLMAADLADGPRTGLHAQLCGDAHLSNFGIFAAPDRRLVFSINDFDETLPGPFEWDVKRLAASFAVAGRDRGFERCEPPLGRDDGGARVPRGDGALRARCATSTSGTRASTSPASSTASAQASSGKQMKRFQRERRQRAHEGQPAALSRSCVGRVDGELRIVGNPPLVTPIEDVLPGAERGAPRGRRAAHDSHLPAHAAARPAQPARELPLRACRPEGRRRRQRGRPHLDPAPGRPRRRRPAVPPVQGGAGIGARAVPREEPVRPARTARRRGAADDAGGRRHPARLGADRHDRRARRRTSTSGSSGTRRARPRSS